MRIVVLCENTKKDEALREEHGLSLYIETKEHKILFDMGQTDAFYYNALTLGVDLSKVDIAVLSHGHYDHGGGMAKFLQINDSAKVYVNEHAFEEHYNGTEKYIGLDGELRTQKRVCLIGDAMDIDGELSLYSCNTKKRKVPVCPFGLKVKQGDVFSDETFIHEHYLEIRENGKRVLISGCSHKGIRNIMDWFSPDVLVGGFHFMKLSVVSGEDRSVLDEAAKELSAYNTVYYTGHCTGQEQYEYLKTKMGDRLSYMYTGREITI